MWIFIGLLWAWAYVAGNFEEPIHALIAVCCIGIDALKEEKG